MNKFHIALVLAALVGCGGYDVDSDVASYDDTEAAVGQVEQAYVTQQATSGASRKWTGVLRSTAGGLVKDSCQSLQAGSSVCYVPGNKTMRISAANNNCTQAAFDNMNLRVDEAIANANTALSGSGWVLIKGTPADSEFDFQCDTYMPGGTTEINDYVQAWDVDSLKVILSESLPGEFYRTNAFIVYVDGDAVLALGTSQLNDVKAMRHAVGHGLVKGLGVGRSSNSGVVSRSTISGSGDLSVGILSPGELCRTRNYALGNTSQYGTSTSANCSND